jgi:hypothetical protein
MDKIINIIKEKFPTANTQNQGHLLWVWEKGKLIERFDLNYIAYLHERNELEPYLNNLKENY